MSFNSVDLTLNPLDHRPLLVVDINLKPWLGEFDAWVTGSHITGFGHSLQP